VYVDRESVAVAHSELLLAGNEQAAAIQADLRDVEDVLDHLKTKRLLDLEQPIGLLMLLLLHFVPDSWDPAGIVARYRDRIVPSSYLALSHCTSDATPAGWTEVVQLLPAHPGAVVSAQPPGGAAHVRRTRAGRTGTGWQRTLRSSGLGDISTDAEMNSIIYGGVGRRP
jgi:hypothetical protein